jgi:hypothetical protein
MSPGPFENYCDTVQLGSKVYFTSAMPLLPLLELIFEISEPRPLTWQEKCTLSQLGIPFERHPENPYKHLDRRYKTFWALERNQLFLKDIEGAVFNHKLDFKTLFPQNVDAMGYSTSVLATWYSGEMEITVEECIKEIQGKDFHCVSTKIFSIEKGIVYNQRDLHKSSEYVERECNLNSVFLQI